MASPVARSSLEETQSTRLRNAVARWTGLVFLFRELFQRKRVTIVFYHDVDPDTLDAHLTALGKRYAFVSLREAIEALRSGRLDELPPKPLVVTLDDGHASSARLVDVFRRHAVSPTIFICSGIVGTRRRFWWTVPESEAETERLKLLDDDERLRELAELGFAEEDEADRASALSAEEIQEMRGVVDFQAHTVFHPILTSCSDERSHREIAESRAALQRVHGLDVYAFAYPNGDYGERELRFVERAGYACAVTTQAGLNDSTTDPLRLRRIPMPEVAGTSAVLVRACAARQHIEHVLGTRAG